MKKFLAISFILALSLSALAQTAVKVQAPNLVALDEQFNVSFVISGEDSPSAFEWSAGDDFQLVWGPQKGSSTSIRIINGQRTKSSQTTYTYVLLPKRTGKFQFPAAQATVKGQTCSSGAHSIEVVSNGAQQSRGTASGSARSGMRDDPDSRQETGAVSGEDIFMRMSLSKSGVVVGESITATLKLYQRANIAGFEDVKFPTFNGFWSQETQAPTNIDFHRESIGGVIYNAAVIRGWTLIPQQAGDLRIDPAELVCLVNVRAPHSSTGSIFDSFFQDDYQTIRKRVASGAATVKVRPVPAGAPASFGGGVGSFRMTAALTRDSLRTHDAASLKITVSGKGNVSLLEAPKVNFPPDFEVYDIKTGETSGARTFEYPFIPRSHGDFTIGPIEYSYYDIAAGKYVTLRSEILPLHVDKGRDDGYSESGGQFVPAQGRKDVRDVGNDIRYISTALPSFEVAGASFAGSTLFWLASLLLALLAAAAYFAFRRLAALKADVAGSRNRAAVKMARKRLSVAGSFLSRGLYSAFYEELHRALLGFISDKLNMDAADMTRENISARLVEKGVPDGVASDFTGLLEDCEFARYSPDAGHDAMNTHYEKAVNVISAIDDCMKKTRKNVSVAALVLLALLPAANLRAASASSADSLWTEGVRAYSESRWDDALQAWEAIAATGVQAPELFGNMGNACFKKDDVARAILYYERSLKLDPSSKDVRFNLEYANSLIQDRIEPVPEFFLKTWWRNLSRVLSPDVWSVLFIILFAGMLAMVLLFLLAPRVSGRKIGFYIGIALFLCAALCLDFALTQRSESLRNDSAIVTAAVCSAKSSPDSGSSVDLFVLHEGTRVKIVDGIGEWLNIELADGRKGWISASQADRI